MIQCKKEINAGEDENPFQFILITPLKILAMFVGENLQSKSLILLFRVKKKLKYFFYFPRRVGIRRFSISRLLELRIIHCFRLCLRARHDEFTYRNGAIRCHGNQKSDPG